jgi:2',3'-cyclic-nucleotide 2'-phosphodiesterase (5'-nucleotidase family)
MNLFKIPFGFLLAVLIVSCKPGYDAQRERANPPVGEDSIAVTFLQLNDIYEISPLEGGKYGGMPRVSTLRKALLKENPHTYTMVAGDFLSPSALGTSTYQGKRIAGAQMVEVLNTLGVDFVTFGNHEFDIDEHSLQERINESRFLWVSSNVRHNPGGLNTPQAFERTAEGSPSPFPEYFVILVRTPSGHDLRIGVIAVTLESAHVPYVEYGDPYRSAQHAYDAVKNSSDFVIALTHLRIDQDRELAREIPELKIVLGGHEHNSMLETIGQTVIAKADANARTAFIHRMIFYPETKHVRIRSELKTIDGTIPDDPETGGVVKKWTDRAYEGFRAKGFEPEEIVTVVKEPLDGRESSIRQHATNLGELIAESMLATSPGADASLFNSGSVRLDDQLRGTITQYDIIRTLPFGGKILEVVMRGSLLRRILDTGASNAGTGGFLQFAGVRHQEGQQQWKVGEQPLVVEKEYHVLLTEYLLSGQETNLGFLTRNNPEIISVVETAIPVQKNLREDIRLALVTYLRSRR